MKIHLNGTTTRYEAEGFVDADSMNVNTGKPLDIPLLPGSKIMLKNVVYITDPNILTVRHVYCHSVDRHVGALSRMVAWTLAGGIPVVSHGERRAQSQ